MERIRLEFALSDKDIADIIANTTAPAGVTVGKPAIFTKATADSGGIFVQLAIDFARDIHDLEIGILAAWLYECCVKSGKKKSRVNNEQIVLNKRNIRRLIKSELANQIGRKKHGGNDKHRSPKKCS